MTMAICLPGLEDWQNEVEKITINQRLCEWNRLPKDKKEGSQSWYGMKRAEEYMLENDFWQWGAGDSISWDQRPIDIKIRWKKSKLPDHIDMPLEIRAVGTEKMTAGRNGEVKGKCPVLLVYAFAEDKCQFFVHGMLLRKKLSELGKKPVRGNFWYQLIDIWQAWESIMLEKTVTTLSY